MHFENLYENWKIKGIFLWLDLQTTTWRKIKKFKDGYGHTKFSKMSKKQGDQ